MGVSVGRVGESANMHRQNPRVQEALEMLRSKNERSTTLERLRFTAQSDAQVKQLPQPLQLGHGLRYLLDNIAVPVSPHDLLLGRILEEIPDEEGERFFRQTVERWKGRSIPPWMQDSGHECFAWERLLRLGLSGLEDFARQELARRRDRGEADPCLHFLEGAVLVYQAFRRYARRYASAAQKAGLYGPSARCLAIAERPPETFAEALQLVWLVGHVYCTMLARNPTLTFGRMDELLLDFYRNDIASARLTRDEAGDLIEDFYCKNNLILGRGEHQMGRGSEKDTGWERNLSYDAPQYVVLGGRRKDDASPANELTELFLERVVPRFENPVVVFRYTPDTPERIWRLACEKMRANASMMVYNDGAVLPAMIRSGIPERDAVTYTMHGCNWPDIPGVQRQLFLYEAWLPHLFLKALLGDPPQSPPPLHTIDELYERFATFFRAGIESACNRLRAARAHWQANSPGELRVDDCFLDGPVARARSWQYGGVKYPTVTCAICSLATVADCFAAVDELVFRSKLIPLQRLRQALTDNFAGNEDLRRTCLNAPKLGQDDDRADRHAVHVLHTVLREIDKATCLGSDDEVIVFRCIETDMRHIKRGATTGATPDGRRAGQPTSENTSPYPGTCTKGLTAMLRSLAKLPLARINSGALNVRISPNIVKGREGLNRLGSVLQSYFQMGGLQVQLSLVDTQELRDAQRNPEMHRDLMVRITGYSAVYVDMTRAAQDEIIRRDELLDESCRC